MANRTPTADLLKGIAALLMIQVHIIELFATHDIFKSNLGKLLLFLGGPPVAPLFMVVFGYFIAQSKKPTIQLVVRGVKILFLGLFLNLALNFNLILSVNKGLLDINIWPYIFGVDILYLAGLSIIIIALLKKTLDKSFVLVIPFIIVSAYLGSFLLQYNTEQPFLKYILSLFYGTSGWSYFPLFPWLSYSLTGILLYKATQNFDLSSVGKPKIKIILGACFLLFLTLTIRFAIRISSDLPAYYHHGLIFFLWVISFLFFYSFFINEIDKRLGATILFIYLKWLGKNITIVYIIQWVIIGNIATEIYKTVSDPLYLLLWFASVLLISSGICYSWIKIKEMLIKKQLNN
ncbi:MAG: heparan-alpha-glucosaminide N-acetyltransferase domain-containing protein [Bacteroidetes bacterium]|nr:heparan-alpha-glucosaminide N-acetyltransferase domain-containing protein [Bacteroidota bacterium]